MLFPSLVRAAKELAVPRPVIAVVYVRALYQDPDF